MCVCLYIVGTSTSTCFRERPRSRKWLFWGQKSRRFISENERTDFPGLWHPSGAIEPCWKHNPAETYWKITDQGSASFPEGKGNGAFFLKAEGIQVYQRPCRTISIVTMCEFVRGGRGKCVIVLMQISPDTGLSYFHYRFQWKPKGREADCLWKSWWLTMGPEVHRRRMLPWRN